MTASTDVVTARINYAGPVEGPPRFDIVEPERTNMAFTSAEVEISDVRAHRGPLTLEHHGFTMVKHRSAVAGHPDLFDQNMQRQIRASGVSVDYEREMAAFIQSMTGAREIIPQMGGLVARTSESAPRKSWALPAPFVHLDFTATSARQFLDWSLAQSGREVKPFGRFALFQTWRAVSRGPQDNTLAICDGSSVPPEDGIVYYAAMGPEEQPGACFESRLCWHRPSHRWYYMSNMEADDLFVFKGFDSDMPMAMNAMHTAFRNPHASGGEPRRSIEARFFALFD